MRINSEYDLVSEFTVKYPPRGAWLVHRSSTGPKDTDKGGVQYYHSGYWTDKVRPCPCCGRRPVFQEYYYASTGRDKPAKIFIGICPTCELRTREPGTLKDSVYAWQRRDYSPDSWLHCHRPRLDTYMSKRLCDMVVRDAIDDALQLVDVMAKETPYTEAYQSHAADLDALEGFFRRSPLLVEMDADGILSDIRRVAYPELTPAERVKIPLRMSKLCEYKEYANKCLRQRSLSTNV